MELNRNSGEKNEGSGSVESAHCIVRRQFRAAEFRALYCTSELPELNIIPRWRGSAQAKAACGGVRRRFPFKCISALYLVDKPLRDGLGAPSPLRRDQAKDNKSVQRKEIQVSFLHKKIRDSFHEGVVTNCATLFRAAPVPGGSCVITRDTRVNNADFHRISCFIFAMYKRKQAKHVPDSCGEGSQRCIIASVLGKFVNEILTHVACLGGRAPPALPVLGHRGRILPQSRADRAGEVFEIMILQELTVSISAVARARPLDRLNTQPKSNIFQTSTLVVLLPRCAPRIIRVAPPEDLRGQGRAMIGKDRYWNSETGIGLKNGSELRAITADIKKARQKLLKIRYFHPKLSREKILESSLSDSPTPPRRARAARSAGHLAFASTRGSPSAAAYLQRGVVAASAGICLRVPRARPVLFTP
ncbi:hypothetical protein EVAR_19423_1 [Eumeta japonica]|uniref:Uncharacterized protein n=1 Tax=Eumeta variegata TaxID=151549 RepID=A0A4C1TRU3_EUMVA|nr:hypothetical protein EVAR_19423_1 [Eumeta japonica]